MKRPKADQVRLVEAWKGTPQGTDVILTQDNGDLFPTKTRSGPLLLGGHTAVIQVNGIAGCYRLDRVRKVQDPAHKC
jgi:hypothetical protein